MNIRAIILFSITLLLQLIVSGLGADTFANGQRTDSNEINKPVDDPLKVRILYNVYNEYYDLNKNVIDSLFSSELIKNGFEVVTSEESAINISIQVGIVIKYDEECGKYFSVYSIDATEYTGYRFGFISGPDLNISSNKGEMEQWFANKFKYDSKTMNNLYYNY